MTHLRYAGEFNGFRLAGVLGYERVTDVATPGVVDPANVAYTGRKPNITVWGLALSAKHVPTGLFVQGAYNSTDYGGQPIGASSGYWGESTVWKKPAEAVAHPGRLVEERVRLRQLHGLRRVRQGKRLGRRFCQLRRRNLNGPHLRRSG